MRLACVAILMVSNLAVWPANAADYTPEQCPVVGNAKSKIYHLPSHHGYGAMLKQNKSGTDNRACFPTPEAAEKAGFRAAKS